MIKTKGLSRRRFNQAAVGAAALMGFPYIKSASSAGKLSIGTIDHWIPGNNAVLREICEQWGADNGVEVTVDFITVIGGKLVLTAQAESRAEIGHHNSTMNAISGQGNPANSGRIKLGN